MSVEEKNTNSSNNETAQVNEAEQTAEKSTEAEATTKTKTVSKKTKSKKIGSVKSKRKPNAKKTIDSNKRTRVMRSFPASTFEDALTLAQAVQQFGAGQKVRRLTLFDNLQKSPDSGYSRMLVTNSIKYGLTTGSYNAEYLELTPDGKIVTNNEIDEKERLKAKFRLAIENIQPFNQLYEQLKGNKLPAHAVLHDYLLENGYKQEEVNECVDTFVVNAKYLTLLRVMSGSERLLSIEHILEELPKSNLSTSEINYGNGTTSIKAPTTNSEETEDWSKICFYITPIGASGSEHRQHSDLFLSQIVEPALEEFGIKVVRADQIGQPGLITTQIIEHIIKSRLAIADLSFHNANVFYELCLRHAFRLPTVQIIRVGDTIPFDVNQVRTIQIDNTSIYTLLPRLESYRAEIANQVRSALNNPDAVDNPLTIFYPNLGVIQNK